MEPLTLAANLEELDLLEDYLTEIGEKASLSKKTVYNLRLAVDELATNIIIHGYLENNTPEAIKISPDLVDDTLILCLEDNAPPFNSLETETPDLDLPPEKRAIGGLGLYLAKSSVNDFRYERVGNCNRNILVVKAS